MLRAQFYKAFTFGEMPGQIRRPVRRVSQQAVLVELRLTQHVLHGGPLLIYPLA
jgi:hypothetical protein